MAKDVITGRYVSSAIYIDRVCENCGVNFKIKESRLKHGGGKCCSRLCVDTLKKEKYKGTNNPAYGTKLTDDRKLLISEQSKVRWQDPIYRASVEEKLKIFREKALEDGTWDKANQKRIQTMIERYGVSHNWEGMYGERDCDKTFLHNYGVPSHEYRDGFFKNKDTNIEIKVASILTKYDIQFIPQHKIGVTKKYKFDFYLPELNMLIECDGDYWHGKNLSDEELNETQILARHYDNIKNQIAIDLGIKLFRFWGSEISKKNFEEVIMQKIWQK